MRFSLFKEERIQGEEIDLVLIRILKENKMINRTKTYFYDIVLHSTNTVIGQIDLRLGMNDDLYYYGNIGYGIDSLYRGNRYAYKACVLLLQVAREERMKKLIITCNPDNIASYKTCEALGAIMVGEISVPSKHELYQLGETRKCIFELAL